MTVDTSFTLTEHICYREEQEVTTDPTALLPLMTWLEVK